MERHSVGAPEASEPRSRRQVAEGVVLKSMEMVLGTRSPQLLDPTATLIDMDVDSVEVLELAGCSEELAGCLLEDEQLDQIQSLADLVALLEEAMDGVEAVEARLAQHASPSEDEGTGEPMGWSLEHVHNALQRVHGVLDGDPMYLERLRRQWRVYPRLHKVPQLVLGSPRVDLVLDERGLVVCFPESGRNYYAPGHAPMVLAEIIRLVEVESIGAEFQGPLGPGTTPDLATKRQLLRREGGFRTVSVPAGVCWIRRTSTEIKVSIREPTSPGGVDFPVSIEVMRKQVTLVKLAQPCAFCGASGAQRDIGVAYQCLSCGRTQRRP